MQIPHYKAQFIARCFKTKDFTPIRYNFFEIEDDEYLVVRELDGNTVYAKGYGGITMQASKKAVVIAHCPHDRQQGNVNKGVAVIVAHLESVGF